jgi:hypothetical protein
MNTIFVNVSERCGHGASGLARMPLLGQNFLSGCDMEKLFPKDVKALILTGKYGYILVVLKQSDRRE